MELYMFQRGKTYKHKSTLDVNVYVLSEPVDLGDEISMKIRYWNAFYRIFQGDIDCIIVKKQHLDKWKEINE